MLEPYEVARAMAFPDHYIPRDLPKKDQVKLAGNAVTAAGHDVADGSGTARDGVVSDLDDNDVRHALKHGQRYHIVIDEYLIVDQHYPCVDAECDRPHVRAEMKS